MLSLIWEKAGQHTHWDPVLTLFDTSSRTGPFEASGWSTAYRIPACQTHKHPSFPPIGQDRRESEPSTVSLIITAEPTGRIWRVCQTLLRLPGRDCVR